MAVLLLVPIVVSGLVGVTVMTVYLWDVAGRGRRQLRVRRREASIRELDALYEMPTREPV